MSYSLIFVKCDTYRSSVIKERSALQRIYIARKAVPRGYLALNDVVGVND